MDLGKHPAFIGRELVKAAARNGGAIVFIFAGFDAAVAVVNPKLNCLLVLNVHPRHRAHGLGTAVLAYLQCNFARVLESAIPFFERNGYTAIGEMKQGNALKTQIMVKKSLLDLAGRVSRVFAER